MAPLNEIISLTGVTKVFRAAGWKKKTAVNDLTLSVASGATLGLLGPNGSGKSTTIKMILGFLRPTKGEILVGGISSDSYRARALIGYLPENPRFQRFLTAESALHYFGHLNGMSGSALKSRSLELLELVNLSHVRRERVSGFSKGMTQRLAIAQSLLNRPPILIFDEPMSGLDPLGRIEIRKLIAEIRRNMPRTTIFFSTHILEDVELLCSHVALMKLGNLQTLSTISELLQNEGQRYQVLIKKPQAQLPDSLQSSQRETPNELGLILSIDGDQGLYDTLSEIRKAGLTILSISSERKSLEQALFSQDDINRVRQLGGAA